MKSATAILKNKTVFVQAYAQAKTGLWIAYGPVFQSPLHDEAEIARCVRSALEHSIEGIAHPTREGWKEVQRPMLEAVGAKNWNALAKGAKAIGIELNDGIIELSPSADYGNEGGSDLPDLKVEVEHGAANLGAMIVKALELSS